MFEATFNWNGGEIEQAVREQLQRRIVRVGEFLKARAIQNVSIPTRSAGPSLDGEFPHSDTGELRQSIYARYDLPVLTGYVGSRSRKAAWLEFGRSGRGRITGRNGTILIQVSEAVAKRAAGGALTGRGSRKRKKKGGIIRRRGKTYLVRAWSTHVPMRARPWLSRTMHESQREIMTIMKLPLQIDTGPGPTRGLR